MAWGRTQQRKAGNPYSDQLFTVLLSSKDNLPGSFAAGVPMLQVCDANGTLGANVCHCVPVCLHLQTCKWFQMHLRRLHKCLLACRREHTAAVDQGVPALEQSLILQTAYYPYPPCPRKHYHQIQQVLPQHPLLTVGATGINATCRGLATPSASHRRLQATPSAAHRAYVTTVPRVAISYILNPVLVPEPPGLDSVDKFVARYGAENATINPDMAEAEVARQISKLQELAVSTNASVAEAAKKALQAYSLQQKTHGEEEAAIVAAEAAMVGNTNKVRTTFPLSRTVPVGEFSSLSPAPRIKLDRLDTLPDVSAGGLPHAC